MALPDFTGQYIQDTYQRVLQVSSSGDITDGTGSLFTPPNAISASYALSASHEIIKEISSSHADTASYIEASNIDQPFTSITSSGTVSASGNIYGKDFYVGGSQFTDVTTTANHFGIGLNGWGSLILANITASGNISSSAASTSSFGTYLGDGSQLTGIETDPFPYTGSAIITGSLEVHSSNSVIYFESGSSAGSNDGKILMKSTGGPANLSLWRTDGVQAAYNVGSSGVVLYYDDTGYFGIQPTSAPAEQTSFGGATAFYMSSSGKVGINTDNPLSRFYVVGKIATTTDVSASGDMYGVTGSFKHLKGDGSQLTNIIATSASYAVTASYVDIESLPLINPIVEYHTCAALTSSGTTVTLPNNLTFVSSSTYEYVEVYFNGLRLRYDVDFIPQTTESIEFQIALPSGSELTYKSIKRP